jgi:hypothetical protein
MHGGWFPIPQSANKQGDVLFESGAMLDNFDPDKKLLSVIRMDSVQRNTYEHEDGIPG